MEERGYECLFISPGPNLRYLTSFYFPYPGEAWGYNNSGNCSS
ncbi:MAG: hypothetical protein ACE5KJ_07050 [Candidatus Zixiibacteriota bacterium]